MKAGSSKKFDLKHAMYAAAAIFLTTLLVGITVDMQRNALMKRNAAIQINVERFINHNEIFFHQIDAARVERNILLLSEIDENRKNLDNLESQLLEQTGEMHIFGDMLNLCEQSKVLRAVGDQAIKNMEQGLWEVADLIMKGGDQVMGLKLNQIDSDAIVGGVALELKDRSRIIDSLSQIAFGSRILAFLLLLWVGYAYSTQLKNQLAEKALLEIELDRKLKAREQELEISYEKLRVIERREILSEERRRLVQDMHDGMGSSLVTALKMVERNALNPQDFAQVLTECIDDLKLALDAMETEAPDLLSILGTLRFRIGRRLKASGMDLVWQVQDVPPLPWLNGQTALHILRILQEVLTNIVKHAHAGRIVIATSTVQDRVEVTVEDDGKGFEPEHPATLDAKGRGLGNLRRRAQALQAHANWVKLPGGTRFVLSLPIHSQA